VNRTRRIAQRIRHLPVLKGADVLWRVLRRPYRRLLDAGGQGVEIAVGGAAVVRMPAEFAGGSWENYEPEAVKAYAQWIEQHPGALVLDAGSSIGIYSAIALFADRSAEVLAFDPDLPSLAAARRLCRHAPGARLRLVHGFLADKSAQGRTLAAVVTNTEADIARLGVRGEQGTARYVCLSNDDGGGIPKYSLDDLLAAENFDGRPVLLKCDVEGGELLVLRGAEAFLRRAGPALLISVHPPALPIYGHTTAFVKSFLVRLGYEIRVLAVDHEEHWWCEHRLGAPELRAR